MTTADVWTDFNGIHDGNLVITLLRHCNVNPLVGSTYTFGDGDGNWCLGTVEAINNALITARLDLTTWHNAGEDGTFVRGNMRLASLLSDPTIAAEVTKVEEETKNNDEGK